MYVNELPINIQKAETVFGAGDANVLTEDTYLNHKIRRVTTEFLIWFDANGIEIDTKKVTAVSLHTW
jgi:hypothetical protein